jgi:hypothetical protein
VKESDQLIWLIAWLGISKTPVPGKGEGQRVEVYELILSFTFNHLS